MTTPLDRPPAWVADAVFYQIFPDRFARSGRVSMPTLEAWDTPPTVHGYKGGDLWGVVERLDWVQELGCNAIYLNPIFQSASNHRYHTHDYFTVDPMLGGMPAFEALRDACHERGMRLVLDGVFNHASRGFFQFNDILEAGERSPWRDWFNVHEYPVNAYDHSKPASYDAWWGLHALPKFNTENADVREFLMEVGEYWVEQGVDGWRLDVPLEIQTPGFWEEFRTRVRAKNPDAYIVAEIWDDAADWISRGDRFDAAMNYLFTGAVVSLAGVKRINWELADRLDYSVRDIDAAGYSAAVDHILALYPEFATKANLNLLGSHDTARLLSIVGDDPAGVRLAFVLAMTFPGAPCIYYGDEIGLAGGHDPDCRAGFPWGHEEDWHTGILGYVRTLTGLRHAHPELRHGTYHVVTAKAETYLYAFVRRLGDSAVLVAVNAGDEPSTFGMEGAAGGERLLGDADVGADGTVTVPARTAGIWKLY